MTADASQARQNLCGRFGSSFACSRRCSSAQGPDTAALWRHVFKRPDTPPAPADNPLTPEKIALGASCSPTLGCPAPGGIPVPAATGPHLPSRTDAGRPAPLTGEACGAIRRRCGISPGASSSSGMAARRRWKRRCACRSRRPTRWVATGRPSSSGSRRTPVSSPSFRPHFPRARHFGRHGRQGARVLCPLAGFAAGPVRCLDRR